MQIILNEDDISKALTGHLISMGINLEGKKVETTFTAGRKENGNTATLTIVEEPNEKYPTAQTQTEVPEKANAEETEAVAEQGEESPTLDLTEDSLVFEES